MPRFRGKNVKARPLPVTVWDSPGPMYAMVTCALAITAPPVSVTLPVSSAFFCALLLGTHIFTAVIALAMRRSFIAFIHGLEETAIPLRFSPGRTDIVLFTCCARETVAAGEKSSLSPAISFLAPSGSVHIHSCSFGTTTHQCGTLSAHITKGR